MKKFVNFGMAERVYIDTSVIGGYFDEEFSFFTKLFFEKVDQGKFKVILSDILATKLQGAHLRRLSYFMNQFQKIKLNTLSKQKTRSD